MMIRTHARGALVVILLACTFLVVMRTSRHIGVTSTGWFPPPVDVDEENETLVQSMEPTEGSREPNVPNGNEGATPTILPRSQPKETSGWRARLYTPTHLVKFNGTYLVVDCWHHRLLFSDDITLPISRWRSVFEGAPQGSIVVPHSIATDGRGFVTESSVGGSDGDHHTLVAFERVEDGFATTQTLMACPGNKARRPHRVIYDEVGRAFYLYLTNPPHLAKFKRHSNGTLYNVYCNPIAAMGGVYARSIAIRNTSLFITAGPKSITELSIADENSFRYARSYPSKPIGIYKGKMNDLAFIDGWWYATSTGRCGIGRFRDLHNPRSSYQDLTPLLSLCRKTTEQNERCLGGTPYYVTSFEGRIYVPYIFGCSGVVSFVGAGSTITNVQHHWDGGWPETAEDMEVRGTKW